MRAHFLQHVAFEGLGSIEPWLESRGATPTRTRFFLGDSLPDVGQIDFLIAIGGPMSVNDEAQLAWLEGEKEFIHEAIARDIAALRVCLGHS